MKEFGTVKDLDDYIQQGKRLERIYMAIFLGTMVACFIVGILIGQIASLP
jgi:hypothetical protein